MGRTSTKTGGMTTADWIILAGAATYLAWTIVPAWYRAGGGKAFGIPLPSYAFNAWRGTTTFAALVAIVSIAWLGLRSGGVRPWAGRSVVDLILASAGLGLTLLGLAVPPATGVGKASVSWALPVGIVLALLWAWGAVRKYREHRSADRSATIAGSGFGTGVRP